MEKKSISYVPSGSRKRFLTFQVLFGNDNFRVVQSASMYLQLTATRTPAQRNSQAKTHWGQNNLMGVSLAAAFLKWATALVSVGGRSDLHSEIHCTKALATAWAVETPVPTCLNQIHPPPTPKNIHLREGTIHSPLHCVVSHIVPIEVSSADSAGTNTGHQGEDALPRGQLGCSPTALRFFGWVQQSSGLSASPCSSPSRRSWCTGWSRRCKSKQVLRVKGAATPAQSSNLWCQHVRKTDLNQL